MEKKKDWWKESVVYQIYPKSFQDSDGDGIGDIKGITNRLEYLNELGVNVLWICPVYKSPMDDGGYDISDYYQVDDMFGNNEDLDELINKAKMYDIEILMDLVVNHTSDEHEWFEKALADPKSKYRNYYVFKKGKDGGPPNNWRSYFGGSAWEKVDGEENMYYLHAFSKKQPDLNWENEELREEIYKMINYWLDKGLAGFRIDAILNIKKRFEYGFFEPDGEDDLVFIGKWILNQPGIEVWLNEMNEKTFLPHNSMTVAEADVPENRLKEYIGDNGYFSMVFDFSYTDIDVPETGEWYKQRNWTWEEMKENIYQSQYITQNNGWGALYLENHDQPRSINKYIPKEHINDYSKKMLATLFMMLRGTPFIYQGQELGMTNITIKNIDIYDDIATKDQYKRAVLSGMSEEEALEHMNNRSRDNSRTPIQWDRSKNAGFSKSDNTWLPVNENYKLINAQSQREDEHSVLSYYKKLVALRTKSIFKDIVIYGEFGEFSIPESSIIAYERKLGHNKILVLINYESTKKSIDLGNEFTNIILSNYEDSAINEDGHCTLRPFESIVITNIGDKIDENKK